MASVALKLPQSLIPDLLPPPQRSRRAAVMAEVTEEGVKDIREEGIATDSVADLDNEHTSQTLPKTHEKGKRRTRGSAKKIPQSTPASSLELAVVEE